MAHEKNYEPSAGVMHGVAGAVMTALGVLLAAEAEAQVFAVLGVGLLASGAYCTGAGMIARGIQLGRR